ncbi:efflux RND transporter periplasmic adaptor subunit [candidate division KSB1 bacterium]|nr:efflux RND transporter periplasmic adaptor subunit [candidate division KSB1 bacterium]
MKHYSFAIAIGVACAVIGCSKNQRDELDGSGVFEATEVILSAKTAGDILAISVEEGEFVVAGQTLALVDTQRLELEMRRLRASFDELAHNRANAQHSIALALENRDRVQKQFSRIEVLLQEGSATQQQFDELQSAVTIARLQVKQAQTALQVLEAKREQLQAQIELLQIQLRDSRIVAPLDGVLLARYIEKGESVHPGSPVVKIADLSIVYIKVYIGESDLDRVGLDMPVEIRIDGRPEKRFPGRVAWISSKAEFTPKNVQTREMRASLVYAVQVRVDNPEGLFKIGMPADVFFALEHR